MASEEEMRKKGTSYLNVSAMSHLPSAQKRHKYDFNDILFTHTGGSNKYIHVLHSLLMFYFLSRPRVEATVAASWIVRARVDRILPSSIVNSPAIVHPPGVVTESLIAAG